MIREICDVCKKNDADEKYCFQKSTKIKYQNTSRGIGLFRLPDWTTYETIMICHACAEKLFEIKNG